MPSNTPAHFILGLVPTQNVPYGFVPYPVADPRRQPAQPAQPAQSAPTAVPVQSYGPATPAQWNYAQGQQAYFNQQQPQPAYRQW